MSERNFEWGKVCPVNRNYVVTESGKVGRIGKDTHLKPCKLKRGGYLAVNLWSGNKGKTFPVHQLVTLAFHGPRPSPNHHAAHRDGDKTNNHWTNLRWATREENEADKLLHGTSNRGERNGMAKLTDTQVAEIKKRIASGERQARLVEEYGVSAGAISNIYRGKRRG